MTVHKQCNSHSVSCDHQNQVAVIWGTPEGAVGNMGFSELAVSIKRTNPVPILLFCRKKVTHISLKMLFSPWYIFHSRMISQTLIADSRNFLGSGMINQPCAALYVCTGWLADNSNNNQPIIHHFLTHESREEMDRDSRNEKEERREG